GIKAGQARLSGYCTAKGRLLGTMVVWRSSKENEALRLHALLKSDIAEAVTKRLSMFVLRAKVRLALADRHVFGITIPASADASEAPGAAEKQEATGLRPPASDGKLEPWVVRHTDEGTWIAAPSAASGVSRWWLIATAPIGAIDAAEAASNWRADDIAA